MCWQIANNLVVGTQKTSGKVLLFLPRSFSTYKKSAVCSCHGGSIWKSESSYSVQTDLGIIELGLGPVSEWWDYRFFIKTRFKCGFKVTVVGWIGRV
jgi:hypothetical protein